MKKNCIPLAVLLLLAATASLRAQFFYTFNVGSTSYIITGYYGPDGSVSIPEKIGNLYVTGIADNAFLEETGVTNVTIPSSVTAIGASAFAQSGLTSVTVPGSVNSIGASAFANCGNLTNATIEDGVVVIGASAFSDCPMLATVTLPSSIIGIEPYAFSSCSSLTNLTLASGLISIGDGAFEMTGLSSISVPGSVAVIGEGAFYHCSALQAITVDVENTNFSGVNGVLFNKSQTALVQCPSGLSGAYAIPSGVTSIGVSAFAYCRHLDNVMIPSGVSSIGVSAFAYCQSLKNVVIPDSVSDIATNAFQTCDNLTSVTIPNGVTNIGNSTFGNCTSLRSVTIPGSVGSIGEYAFNSCFSLTNVSMANGVGSIADGAFGGCNGLRSITIPASVTNIGANALSTSPESDSFYFLGNAPSTDPLAFAALMSGTVYYLPGTTGWSNTLGGLPTAQWKLPYPVILNSTTSFGVRSNGFGFSISWATNRPVIVQASTDLANPVWTTLQTNALTNGVFNFSDPQWANYPGRFYRIIGQ
jgi:hypothetical protein